MIFEMMLGFIATVLGIILFNQIVKENKNFYVWIFVIICTVPFIFLSLNMVSDTITADELQYMKAIVNMRELLKAPDVASKLMLQYRTSQMIFGTIYNLIPRSVYITLSETELIVIYKLLHWFLFYIVGLGMVFIVYKEYIVQTKVLWKNAIAYIGCFAVIVGLPIAISVMKICNYDASNIMFGSLAILLVSVEVRNVCSENIADKKYSCYTKVGLFISILGCLDKWSSGVYFLICAILCVFIKVKKANKYKIKTTFLEAAKIIGYSLIIGFLNLKYIQFVLADGELYEKIGLGHITFSFTNLFFIIFEGVSASVTENALFYLFLLYVIVAISGLILCFIVRIMKKINIINILNVFTGLVLSVFVISGILATYFVPQMFGGFAPVSEGEYFSTTLWGVYHYGANSWVGHKWLQTVYAFATIICNLPTSVLIMIIFYIMILFRKRITDTFYPIVILGCIGVIVVFAYMDQPSDPRYFGVSIFLLCLCIFTSIFNFYISTYESIKFKRNLSLGLLAGLMLWNIELVLYTPNVKIFAPLWSIHSQEWNKTVRLGHWYAGEAMSWGEELAIAGRKIKLLVEKKEDTKEDITIYSNYGVTWLANPGYTIKHLSQVNAQTDFNELTYFVFTKKQLFRTNELYTFLSEVDPLDVVEYRGEICSWIYSGDQIKNYSYYFNQ